MMRDSGIDSDVLIKLSAYRMLEDGVRALSAFGEPWVLGAAPFLVPKKIRSHPRIQDKAGALRAWSNATGSLRVLEPTSDELKLATRLEEAAAQLAIPLDVGESQLLAVAVARNFVWVVTGDKRAIGGAEKLQATVSVLGSLSGRLVCLEQLVERLAAIHGAQQVRASVCSEAMLDTALGNSMGCSSITCGSEYDPTGLTSYIESVRRDAPKLLAAALTPGAS